MPKLPFEWGVAHYDEPPHDRLLDLDALEENDLFREANELKAWIEVDDDGKITGLRLLGRRAHRRHAPEARPPRGRLPGGAVPADPGRARGAATARCASSSRPAATWACPRRAA